jgi:hypothetical protein
MVDAPTARDRLLRGKVEHVLSPAVFLRDVFLVSRVTSFHRISASDLSTLPVFINLRASAADLLKACMSSSQILVSGEDLCLPYSVVPTVLVLRQGESVGTIYQIGEFVRGLIGGIRHWVWPTGDRGDIAVGFWTVEDCLAAWRALLIVPFEGRMLEIEAGSAPFSYARGRREAGVAAPAEPVIVVEAPKGKVAKIEITKALNRGRRQG